MDTVTFVPETGNPRVLIVNSNLANRAAFATLLEGDYAVQAAESGPQALELTLLEEFAVILLDVRIPIMDGFETAALLCQRERTRNMPIIFMSAYDQNVIHIRKRYVAGANEFLSSPADEDLLLFKVGAYAKLHERYQAMKLHIHQLNGITDSLRVEANLRSSIKENVFRRKIGELEENTSKLTSEISATLN